MCVRACVCKSVQFSMVQELPKSVFKQGPRGGRGGNSTA